MNETKRKYEFKIGDLFPSDDDLGRWVMALSIIRNDIALTNHYLIQAMKKSGDDLSPDSVYFFRLVISHLREAFRCQQYYETQFIIVKQFINTLDNESKNIYDNKLYPLYNPWNNSFIEKIARPIRNTFIHYPNKEEDDKDLKMCLSRLVDHFGSVSYDSNSGTRYLFCDDVCSNLVGNVVDGDMTRVKNEIITKIGDICIDLITFIDKVIEAYAIKKNLKVANSYK